MPTYCYRVETTDEIIRFTWPIKEMLRRQAGTQSITLPDGIKAYRDIQREQKDFKDTPGAWQGFSSSAMGVHASQLPERMALDVQKVKEYGDSAKPDHYTADGDPVFSSRKQRNTYAAANGFHDRDAGYSDAVPTITKEESFKQDMEDLGDAGSE